MVGACPRCSQPLPAPSEGGLSCGKCGTRWIVRTQDVRGMRSRKVAGVRRRRYQIDSADGGEPLVFEGPPGLDDDAPGPWRLLFREGNLEAVLTATRCVPLHPGPSGGGPQTESPNRWGLLWWALALGLLLLGAYLLDTGSLS